VIATVLPAARFGDPTLGEIRILDTQIADHDIVMLSPDTGEMFGFTAAEARAFAADLTRRANHIDPTGGEP